MELHDLAQAFKNLTGYFFAAPEVAGSQVNSFLQKFLKSRKSGCTHGIGVRGNAQAELPAR